MHFGNTLDRTVNEDYLRYWRSCQAKNARDDAPETPPREHEVVRAALARGEAERLSRSFSDRLEHGSSKIGHKKNVPFLYTLSRPLDIFGKDFLDIFDGPLGERLRARFGSEFRILWLDCYRTVPGFEASKAWLWHIDNVPVPMAKVLLYLTDTAGSGGGTALLPIEQSDAYKEAGYTGITTSERMGDDLASFGTEKGIGYDPIRPGFEAGDALIFHTNTLHRGILPERGFRDVMSVFVIPSARPWREHAARDDYEAIHAKAGGFPVEPPPI